MISQTEYEELKRPPEPGAVRAFLYTCDDGSEEVMPIYGGEFKLLKCSDPRVYPLAGGRVTGLRQTEMSALQWRTYRERRAAEPATGPSRSRREGDAQPPEPKHESIQA